MVTISAIKSLETLCIRQIASDFPRHTHVLKDLPHTIKNKLSSIAGQRNHFLEDVDLLEALLNSHTEIVSFGNCNATDHMLDVVKICKHLKVLNIGDNATVTHKGLCDVFRYLQELQHFSAKRCDVVNDHLVTIISIWCPMLTIIDVSDCSHVGNESLKMLATKPLTALNVSGTMVTDIGVQHIVHGVAGNTIREINLDNCSITEKSVELIIRQCKRLFIFSFKNNCFSGDFEAPASIKLKQLSWTVL